MTTDRCGDQMRGVFNGSVSRATCVLARGPAGHHDDELGTSWGDRRDGHWLTFNAAREVVGCHCGFRADADSDCGRGDSVVRHLLAVGWDEGYTAAYNDERESMPDHTKNPYN